MIPKQPRTVNKKYIAYVKDHGCIVCGDEGVDPHHLVSRAAWGSDYFCIPLCREHHVEIEQIGVMKFESKYDATVWKDCAFLLERWVRERI